MFWLITARVFEAPMPATPTIAMLTRSLGAWKPRPSTCRGTMVTAAPAPAALVMNWRRETPWDVVVPCV